MECAGIVEAGGVKNVTLSLCKEFTQLKQNVTLFIPVFKTNSWEKISNLRENITGHISVFHCGKNEDVSYSTAICTDGNFKVVFINHAAFLTKEGVYTYTANEQKENPEFVKGVGHRDTFFMDSIFAKAVARYEDFVEKNELPHIIHCQDASTALVPLFASKSKKLKNSRYIVTIHNAGPAYHHNFSNLDEGKYYTEISEEELKAAQNGNSVEPFLLAVNSGAILTTVSEDYAKEIVDPDFSEQTEGLSSIFHNRKIQVEGITNGIEYERYDPRDTNISCLPYAFNPEKLDLQGKTECRDYLLKEVLDNKNLTDVKIFGNILKETSSPEVFIVYHGRITSQKGISVLLDAIPALVNNFPQIRFIIAGQGEACIENKIIEITDKFSGKVLFINGYNKKIARLVNCSGDFIVLPSFFEPCGLEDFISQLYGTLPVANATGGLKKIIDGKTGFLYTNNSAESLIAKLSEVITLKLYAPNVINKMIKEASVYVRKNYSWRNVIKNKYFKFFKEILKKS